MWSKKGTKKERDEMFLVNISHTKRHWNYIRRKIDIDEHLLRQAYGETIGETTTNFIKTVKPNRLVSLKSSMISLSLP